MSLSFTLSKIDETYQEAISYYNVYKSAVSDLDTIINELEKDWKSEETHTYEEFVALYKTKKKELLEAQELMKQFCDILNMKKESLNAATTSTINDFE